jgi:hypothetical protein
VEVEPFVDVEVAPDIEWALGIVRDLDRWQAALA